MLRIRTRMLNRESVSYLEGGGLGAEEALDSGSTGNALLLFVFCCSDSLVPGRPNLSSVASRLRSSAWKAIANFGGF